MIDRIKKILRYPAYVLHSRIWQQQKQSGEFGDDFFHRWNQAPPPGDKSHTQEEAGAQNPLEREYYANLELPFGASFAEVKKSYRTLIKQYHPDRYHSDPKKKLLAEEITAKLNTAYQHFERKQSQNKGR